MKAAHNRGMQDNLSLGNRLRTARKKREWTQGALAQRAGLTIRRLSCLETDRDSPNQQEWRRLAPLLGLRIPRRFCRTP